MFERLLPEAPKPVYRSEEEEVETQSYNSDAREARILNEVMTYSQAHTNYSGRRTELTQVISERANSIWPNSKAAAQQYYNLVGSSPKRAAELLASNPELEARITWEYTQLTNLESAMAGQLVAATGGLPQAQPQQEGANFNMSPAMQRLIQDYQRGGEPLPDFLMAYLQQ